MNPVGTSADRWIPSNSGPVAVAVNVGQGTQIDEAIVVKADEPGPLSQMQILHIWNCEKGSMSL